VKEEDLGENQRLGNKTYITQKEKNKLGLWIK
jgi:hypothetical protein